MTSLIDGIKSYLEMDSPGALMVSGEWGCGKTYHINNKVIPALVEGKYIPIMVSLFGITRADEIPLKIFEAYMNRNKPSDSETWGKVKQKAKEFSITIGNVASSSPFLKNFFDPAPLISKYSSILYRFVPADKTVIFLDDVERALDSINIHALLGAINELIEQIGYKVVLIANDSYIQGVRKKKLVFKEKVIGKTLVYEPNICEVFKEICEKEKSDKRFSSSLSSFLNNDQVVSIIDPTASVYIEDTELQKDLQNIRIIQFALAHFQIIYDLYEGILQKEGRAEVTVFLMSLWSFTVGLSIAYKKDLLVYKDKDLFGNYKDIPDDGWQLDYGYNQNKNRHSMNADSNQQEEKKEEEEKEKKTKIERIAWIFKVFVKVHGLPVIVSPTIFEFITAGCTLDEELLRSTWTDYKKELGRNKVNPAYGLLDRLMKGLWGMTNEEVSTYLKSLANYVEKGAFTDALSYINAATYLQHYHELLPYNENDIEKIIRKGIDTMFNRDDINISFVQMGLDAIEDEIPPITKWVVQYEREAMNKIAAVNGAKDVQAAHRLFISNLPALHDQLTGRTGSAKSFDFADYPILRHITKEDIEKRIRSLEPKDALALYNILNYRFMKRPNSKVIPKELTFIEDLKDAIAQTAPQKANTLTDIYIRDSLTPLIEKILQKKRPVYVLA